ncbi:hypothetical protein [Bradyrhizobium liaoningense]|uniref:hypothetical protein n=1 Tax=Bradyrhizobium liaoningense TaxID=43992 RepID=UPI001BA49F65|nr:hypothetical protein [Bradyrhizobium liaoningense]MBR1032943.1 hypothetical protein [Bradyrhizobium liaoningense]
MMPTLWLLLGSVIGGVAGWYAHGLTVQNVRASTNFSFNDNLADRQAAYLSATGSWRGGDLANKINTVQIVCWASDMNCDLKQADVVSLSGGPSLDVYSKSFRVKKLDAESIVAEGLPDLCIRQTLTFDRVAKAVTLVRTKENGVSNGKRRHIPTVSGSTKGPPEPAGP